MHQARTKNQAGYVALISAIVITLILLGLTAVVSQAAFFARTNTLDGEYKRVALGLAESCQNVALLKIVRDYNYQPPAAGETVQVGTDTQGIVQTCDISYAISYSNNNPLAPDKIAVINTVGSYRGTFSKMKVSVTVANPAVIPVHHSSLTAVTHVINNNGGTKQAGDFTLTITGNNPSTTSFAGTETGTYVYFDAGPYTASGSDDTTHYVKTESNCTGTWTATDVVNEANRVCTITYDDKPTTATLTITANVINNDGGTKLPGDFDLFLNGDSVDSGLPTNGLDPAQYTASASSMSGYTASAWGTNCAANGKITLNAGDVKTCQIVFDDNPAPQSLSDTVIMLDRTGSLFNNANDPLNERAAAKAMLNLFAGVTPRPLVGIGSFGGLDGSAAQVPTSGQLTTSYGSDRTNTATAAKFPGAPAGSPNNQWSNANNALVDDTAFATSATVSQKQAYRNFGLTFPAGATINGIEVAVNGKTSSTAAAVLSDNFGTGNTANDIPLWDEEGNDSDSTTVALAPGSGNDSASPDGGRFAKIAGGEWICRQISGAGASGMTLNYYWRGDSDAETSDTGVVEYHTSSGGASCTSGSGWNTLASHQLPDSGWKGPLAVALPAALNNSTFFLRFRANANDPANEYFRVDGVSIGNQPPVVDLSWDNGTSWTSGAGTGIKTLPLTAAEAAHTLGGSTDMWNRAWTTANFSDGSFLVRLTNNTSTGTTVSVDYLTVKIHYTAPPTGLYQLIETMTNLPHSDVGTNLQQAISKGTAELNSPRHVASHTKVLIVISDGDPNNGSTGREAAYDEADAAKLGGTVIFNIHFGADVEGGSNDFAGQELLAALSTGTVSPPSAEGHNTHNHQKGSADDKANSTAGYAQENDDGDHFFIAPQSSDLEDIFNAIGQEIIFNVNPPPAATTGRLVVITHVINDNGGTSDPDDFTMHIAGAGLNPSRNDFGGVDSPGVVVTVSPGHYTIDEAGSIGSYTKILGPDCSGSIAAGETVTCTIINDDLPPLPPAPPSPPPSPGPIIVGSWEETP